MVAQVIADGAEYEDRDGDVWIYDSEHGVFRSKLMTGERGEGAYSPWAPDKLNAKYGPLKAYDPKCATCKKVTAPVTQEEVEQALRRAATMLVSDLTGEVMRLLARKGLT